MFMAYATRPNIAQIPRSDFWVVIGWEQLGLVADMAEAKKRFGGSPVLQAVKQ